MKKPTQYFPLISLLLIMIYHLSIAQNSLKLQEGVIIDTETQSIYFQIPDKRVQARSIEKGQVLWINDQKAKPLVLIVDRLICQSGSSSNTNQLELVSINVLKRGEEISRFNYELPRNIKVNLGKTLHSDFNLNAHNQKSLLYFLWEYEYMPSNGIFDPGAKPTYQKGAFSMEVGSNGPNKISIKELPAIFKGRSIIPAEKDRIQKQEGFQFLSKDDRHVLVSRKVASDATFESYNWILYSVDGKKIGEIRDYRSYAPFYITPSNVLIYEVGPYLRNIRGKMVETPLQLVAIDLLSGKKIWDAPIFDPVYRGPTPP